MQPSTFIRTIFLIVRISLTKEVLVPITIKNEIPQHPKPKFDINLTHYKTRFTAAQWLFYFSQHGLKEDGQLSEPVLNP